MTTLDEVLAGVPDNERQAMVWDNVMGLYNIDQTKL
jgi:hypothetical protein